MTVDCSYFELFYANFEQIDANLMKLDCNNLIDFMFSVFVCLFKR